MTGLAPFFTVAALFFGGAAAFAESALREPQFGPPPRIAIRHSELEQAKVSPDFPGRKAAAIKEAAPFLSEPVVLPEGHGEWIFYYANPATGTRLRPRSPTEHEDPKTGEVFSDQRTQAAYRTLLHYRAEKAALALAWAWAWSGEEPYVAEVRRILLQLARDYPNYPARLDRWGRRGYFARWGGRRYVQALDEATGIIPLAKAYDLTRTSPLYTPEDHALIRDQLFRGTAQSLLQFNQGKVNHQTWYNAGLMAIAGVLEDAALAKRVITMEGGYLDQLRQAVGRDGLWWEGTLAYHLYALRAMIELVEMGENYGLPLADEPAFRRMFTAALPLVYPDGKLPAINDSDPINITHFRSAWQWAADRWDDPLFKRLLSEPFAEAVPEQASAVLPDAGLVILRRGSGVDAAMALLDFGPHGGSHGHFDKLNLLLYANRREWLPDPGRLTYSHAEYKTWVKTTAAHNTVVIDERNQSATQGRLLYFESGVNHSAAAAESRKAYSGTLLRRHLFLTDQFLVDLFEVVAPKRSTIDLLAHARADALEPGSATGEPRPIRLGRRHGYQHLTPAVEYPADLPLWRFTTAENGPTLAVHLLPDSAERIITTHGIGYSLEERTPTLIRRRFARSTRFVTVYDLSGTGQAVRSIAPAANGEVGVTVHLERESWHLQMSPERPRVAIEKLPSESGN